MSRGLFEEFELEKNEKSPLPAAVVMQFLLLYKRNLLTTKRGYVSYLKEILIRFQFLF